MSINTLLPEIIKASRTLGRYALTILSIPIVLTIRIISPFVLVRVGYLCSTRIGHFSANTELYLLETEEFKKSSGSNVIDFVYLHEPVCNRHLGKMWSRTSQINILPRAIMAPICRANELIPNAKKHTAGLTRQSDRDVSGFFNKYPPILRFTQAEKKIGEELLRDLGVPKDKRFVCLHVRDSEYLATVFPSSDTSYHDYRNSNIEDYFLAAKALASRGLYVLRMGSIIKRPLQSTDPMIIDYARSGLRSDFADIYLGAHCFFCISVGSGFDAIPMIFRKPILFVNNVPVEYFFSAQSSNLGIFKHHHDVANTHELLFAEIFRRQAGRCLSSECFKSKDIALRDNSPEEIMNAAVEMVERLEGTFLESEDDKFLQSEFWRVFPKDAVDDYAGMPLHGEIKARISTTYLRSNRSLLGIRG